MVANICVPSAENNAVAMATPLLGRLAPREREVAAIVYRRTKVTARDVQRELSDSLSSAAVRSMLARLVAKGIIRLRRDEGHCRFIYSPAMLLSDVQERALEKTVDEFFDGSFGLASNRLLSVLERHDPRALNELAVNLQQRLGGRAVFSEAEVG